MIESSPRQKANALCFNLRLSYVYVDSFYWTKKVHAPLNFQLHILSSEKEEEEQEEESHRNSTH